ncbi:hypothetical protein [Litoreibacter arenae]|uniref:Uncharacterized protein n=1 Tax=Litoreibacter arenae DSM 19593 TaxID=1123360 RepID=S9Q5A4_9RHOB|nr:hypothetical protein [Litoreibacter arenae]EPX76526.1 hypothetical protein thalar_03656 [Litoreibacter arenae DSM 19593]
MPTKLTPHALAVGLATVLTTGGPVPANAQSYQIDCAILLCLSGGWPASAPCARARAEFIRRITPWPVEPPLQIWRCPMGAAYKTDPDSLTSERIYEILLELDQSAPLQSFPVDDAGNQVTGSDQSLASAPAPTFPKPLPAVLHVTGNDATPLPEGFTLKLAQDRADIDISGPEFNFVRSIRVFQTQAGQRASGEEGECNRYASVRLGSYGTQGDYGWTGSSIDALPDAHVGIERYGDHCPDIWHRSVFVEWRDYVGNYGYEQVNY